MKTKRLEFTNLKLQQKKKKNCHPKLLTDIVNLNNSFASRT